MELGRGVFKYSLLGQAPVPEAQPQNANTSLAVSGPTGGEWHKAIPVNTSILHRPFLRAHLSRSAIRTTAVEADQTIWMADSAPPDSATQEANGQEAASNPLGETGPNPAITSNGDVDPEILSRLEKAKTELALNLAKKQKLDKELVISALETSLYSHETAYLTDPSANLFGNMVEGYEAYVKAPPLTSMAGDHHLTRRKRAYTNIGLSGPTEMVGDTERIFSKSRGSYARALEVRTKEHESAVTSEQESVVPTLHPNDSRKKSRS
ncbi:hypothetical protein MJO28_015240 [Puccinia striiformis f. sp. tritici]|uniref:Uncharacterized protein n=1 Tax=Puccinia striiformis f. sp. tritici TaxID=168172 RepID=A0ACC0DSE5_9BASI|nr:hypothetical protein MJO29_015009 [Puccinia striiformis f. sp. tritici]KAI7938320.1 hypothetical protein MJO28_015240 [Puccinia striiformis f. sp. tritici]